jgi:NAD(P)-dependent dehydrogenase (short-subunit alcohol dehydrogenase family)
MTMVDSATRRPDHRERPLVAVVTGGSAGVGRATVRRLADAGYDVGVLARGHAGLTAAAEDVEARGRRALAIATDVADADAVEQAADRIEAELGPIDVWINVAMTTIFAPLSEIGAAEFERATDVTYLGQVHGTMAALRRMRPRDRGVIVSVGSALAFRSIALQSPYCGAKFACRGFHGAVRAELRHEHSRVRVAQVHLPAVDTPQFGWCRNRLDHQPMPVPPIYPPELCARVIVAVAQRPRRQRIVGWWNRGLIQFDKIAPGLLDHFAARATWEGQQTDEPADPDRDGNLFDPLDSVDDRGASGTFGDQDGGMTEPSFIRSIPGTARDLGRAAVSRCREIADDWLGRTNESER